MKRIFIELASFTRFIKDRKITEDMLNSLQQDMLHESGVTIKKTGGLKKLRFGAQGRGKSGGWRAIYAEYPDQGIVVLITAFSKNVQENISASEARQLKQLKQLLDIEIGKYND